MNKKLIQTNYGLSSAYSLERGDIIEMNSKLVGDLRRKIIKHENRHKSNRHYSKEDFKNDFQSQNSYFLESLKFCIKNPECLGGFFPFLYSYYFKQMTYNSSALFPFIYFGLIFSGFFWLLFKINIVHSIIGFSIFICLMNLILLAWTHKYVKGDKEFVYKEVID